MLQGKIVVVIGGAGLLGKGFCEAIVQHGGTVVVADIDEAAAAAAAAILKDRYPRVQITPAKVDITDRESVCALIASVSGRHGRIDALVNSAYPRNRNYGRKFEDVACDDFCENLNLHLGGYFLAAQQFGLFFRRQGHGNIVSLASIYGMVAPRFEIYAGTEMTMPVEYAVIKAGILSLTRYMARYLKGSNIRVNAISPGGILDNQPDAFLKKYDAECLNKGMLEQGDINGALVFLLSDSSRYVNGQNLVVDDGFSL